MQLLQACRRLLAMFFPELQEAGEGVWVGLEGVPGVLSGAALMELLKRRRGEYEALQEQYQKAGMEREVQLLAPYLSRLTELWAEAEAGGGVDLRLIPGSVQDEDDPREGETELEHARRVSIEGSRTKIFAVPQNSLDKLHELEAANGAGPSGDHLVVLLDALLRMADFARSYNVDDALRQAVSGTINGSANNGSSNMFDMFAQEASALSLSIRLLACVLRKGSEGTLALRGKVLEQDMEARLMSLGHHVIGEYCRRMGAGRKDLLRNLPDVVVCFLDEFLRLSDSDFSRHLPAFYAEFAELIRNGNVKIRASLSVLFSKRISRYLPL
jgi:hypothetical protein